MSQFIVKQTEAKYDAIRELQNAHLDATITVGTQGGDVINVAIQLKSDKSQVASTARQAIFAYISSDAEGDDITATAPDGGWAIGTDGVLIPVVANKAAYLVSESDGDIDLDITEAAAGTWYVILVMPNGRLVASAAVTFA